MEAIKEIIKKRRSVRTYLNKPLEGTTLNRIKDILTHNTVGPFNNTVRFELIDFSEMDRQEIRKLGTYGIIKNAPTFIVGVAKVEDKSMEDFGYCLENIILQLTGLGLGTCWIAGSFQRSSFATRVGLQNGEIVPGITPVGYPAENSSLIDKLAKFTAKSNMRKPWNELFFLDSLTFPLTEELAGKYVIPLEAVRWAPSGSNSQPWRVIKERDAQIYHFFYAGAKGYESPSSEFKYSLLQNINIGIAMNHFQVTAEELGLSGKWQVLQDSLSDSKLTYVTSWVGR